MSNESSPVEVETEWDHEAIESVYRKGLGPASPVAVDTALTFIAAALSTILRDGAQKPERFERAVMQRERFRALAWIGVDSMIAPKLATPPGQWTTQTGILLDEVLRAIAPYAHPDASVANRPDVTAKLEALERRLHERIVQAGNVADSGLTAANVSGGVKAASDKARMTCGELAELFGLQSQVSALRRRLERWRKHTDAGWIENPDATSREAKYLYEVEAVKPIIDQLLATQKRPANVRRKKTSATEPA